MKKLWPLLLLGAMSLYGCKDDDDEPSVQQNLYLVLDQETGLDSLARAIDLADLEDEIAQSNFRTNMDKSNTIFAPDNAAIISLMNQLEITDMAQIPKDMLIDLLSTHVLQGTVLSKDLKPINLVTTLNGQQLEIRTGDAVTVRVVGPVMMPMREQDDEYYWSTVKRADIQASNGVIHIIDEVLLPEDGDMEDDE